MTAQTSEAPVLPTDRTFDGYDVDVQEWLRSDLRTRGWVGGAFASPRCTVLTVNGPPLAASPTQEAAERTDSARPGDIGQIDINLIGGADYETAVANCLPQHGT
jgi:hypothetical protein